MIIYRQLTAKSLEFHEAYEIIYSSIGPEYVEPEVYVRDRLRIQREEATPAVEHRVIPDGYRAHMFAAIDEQSSRVVGVAYGSFFPRIGNRRRGFALIGYVAVLPEYRRRKIARELLDRFTDAIQADANDTTETSAFSLLFEIEKEGKSEIERLVHTMGGYPLDIDYYQPSVRAGYDEQPMNLWMLPLDHPVCTPEEAKQTTFPVALIHDMVKSLFIYEYLGTNRKGFDLESVPYKMLVRSLNNRQSVGFKPYHHT